MSTRSLIKDVTGKFHVAPFALTETIDEAEAKGHDIAYLRNLDPQTSEQSQLMFDKVVSWTEYEVKD